MATSFTPENTSHKRYIDASATATPASVFNARLPVVSHPPAWRAGLEASINANRSLPTLPYVSLATVRPSGRPANRTIFFRGFLTESPAPIPARNSIHENEDNPEHDLAQISSSIDILRLKSPPHHHEPAPAHKNVSDSITAARSDTLSSVLVFVTDARSGSVRDILHGSRFGEICWFMPATKEQFRLSGALHLVMSMDHPLRIGHQVSKPFADHGSSRPNVDWERIRRNVWNHISSVRRASFSWPDPGHDRHQNLNQGFPVHLPSLDEPISGTRSPPPSLKDTESPLTTPTQVSHKNVLNATTKSDSKLDASEITSLLQTPHHLVSEPSDISLHSKTTPSTMDTGANNHTNTTPSNIRYHHDTAFTNFCLLLVEVDSVDYLNLDDHPHTRIKYKKECPKVDEDVYLMQDHVMQVHRWVTKEVNP